MSGVHASKVFVTRYALKQYRQHHMGADVAETTTAVEFSDEVSIETARFMLGRLTISRERDGKPSLYLLSADRWGMFVLAEYKPRDRKAKPRWPYTLVAYERFDSRQRDFILQHWPVTRQAPTPFDDIPLDDPIHPDMGCVKSEIGIYPCLWGSFGGADRARQAVMESEVVSVAEDLSGVRFHLRHPSGVYLVAVMGSRYVVAGLVDEYANEIDDLKIA